MTPNRKRRNWSEFREPHVCRHNDQKDFLIEWCICPLGEDHWHDDVRIVDHRCVREDDLGQLGDPGWWQNPVTQTLRSE